MAEKITTCLWFDNQAEEAADFYVSVFDGGKVLEVSRYGEGGPGPAGTAVIAALRNVVDGPGTDRFLSPELEAADRLVASGEVRAAAESAVGILA